MKKEEIVRKGYDEIALKFKEFRNIFDNLQELEHLATLLPEKAKVLDVGCGIGIPVARFFVDYGFSVTGIDISERMVELAKQNVPKAEFFQYDMNELVFPDNAFYCITAVYSLFHVPREKHFSILKNFHRMLKQEGILFFCVGHLGGDDTDEFLGEEMFWSNYPPERTLSLVKEAEFEILFDEVLDRGDELQYWVFARKK
ncbi:MAG: class I SAM-dependent methyltransferase [Candidatus Heimdallarchaeota archaeon]|nr:class I SAM-dependent methyltransferase [Candidatus Heimdallarchaeota archaeon]